MLQLGGGRVPPSRPRPSTGGSRLPNEVLLRCEEIRRAVYTDLETELVEFNGERDHFHLLARHPPKIAISRLVGSLKGASARRLRQEFPGDICKYSWDDHTGRRPTSPSPAGTHRWQQSRSTSKNRTVPTGVNRSDSPRRCSDIA
ncbi:transposase [Streptomyces sp. NPDC051133]|uniref:transposase n=1 Tax=Streptomyces sp. NPDC051133 TaxID=3155521 RepID=UPI003449F6D7